MKKNKISGVRPFNDFFFKNCYYHQLMAGVSCFGIDRDAILLNAFTLIQSNFNVEKEGFLHEEKLEKILGYKRVHCNINKAKFVRCIDKGQPIIMGGGLFLSGKSPGYLSKETCSTFYIGVWL